MATRGMRANFLQSIAEQRLTTGIRPHGHEEENRFPPQYAGGANLVKILAHRTRHGQTEYLARYASGVQRRNQR